LFTITLKTGCEHWKVSLIFVEWILIGSDKVPAVSSWRVTGHCMEQRRCCPWWYLHHNL